MTTCLEKIRFTARVYRERLSVCVCVSFFLSWSLFFYFLCIIVKSSRGLYAVQVPFTINFFTIIVFSIIARQHVFETLLKNLFSLLK